MTAVTSCASHRVMFAKRKVSGKTHMFTHTKKTIGTKTTKATQANQASKAAKRVSMMEPLEGRQLFAVTVHDISFTTKVNKPSPGLTAPAAPAAPAPADSSTLRITMSDVLISSYN